MIGQPPTTLPPRLPTDVVIDGDDRIVISAAGTSRKHMAVVRLEPDGAFDASFGTGGVAEISPGQDGGFVNADFLADGSVVAAGVDLFGDISDTNYEVVVARFDDAGIPVTGFGGEGHVVFEDPGADFTVGAVVLSTGTDIAVGMRGPLCTALTDSGAVRTDWGDSGSATLDFVIEAIAAGEDGSVSLFGRADDGSVVGSRLDAGGSVDPSFGDAGIATVVEADPDSGLAVVDAITASGRALVAVRRVNLADGATDALVARVMESGGLDPGFGAAGIATVDLSTQDAVGAIAADEAGRIVLAGGSGASMFSAEATLVRLTADGSLDASFGDGGVARPLEEVFAANTITGFRGVAVQADGALIAIAASSFLAVRVLP